MVAAVARNLAGARLRHEGKQKTGVLELAEPAGRQLLSKTRRSNRLQHFTRQHAVSRLWCRLAHINAERVQHTKHVHSDLEQIAKRRDGISGQELLHSGDEILNHIKG